MSARPVVTVQGKENETLPLPAVFLAPIRPDLVNNVHTALNKNRRQPYAVKKTAGEQTSAESWGTGRAVSRIPRVPGGGTHRAGQGAFGNMCRGGRMYAPTKIWRKWHEKTNKNERRYAVASAIAASAVPALVFARGHYIEEVPEVPLVVDIEKFGDISKTRSALKVLESVNALDDVEKVKNSRAVRRGKGKARNRRYVQRRGPLVVHAGEAGLVSGMRNIAGVDLARFDTLNLLDLAPGGHLGRFVVWTKGAFAQLDQVYGSTTQESTKKTGYTLPRAIVTNPDLARIINSPEVQGALRPVAPRPARAAKRHNPLTNFRAMTKLNPHAPALRRQRMAFVALRKTQKVQVQAKKDKRRARMVKFNKEHPSAIAMRNDMPNQYEPKQPKI